MLGKTKTSDISQTGPKSLFTPHQLFFQERAGQGGSRQPWPNLWIRHLGLIGPCVLSEQEVSFCLL